MLIDSYHRQVKYLRLSITKSCPMQCIYCRPLSLIHTHHTGELSCSEIKSLVHHLVTNHGLKKVRLTGGEPTIRPDLSKIIQALRETGITDISLTTNGLTLESQARDLKAAGLNRINVSLDSLDPDKFRKLTGIDGLKRVLRGIDAALTAELTPIKINTVVIRGENESELPALVKFSSTLNCAIRFIELMPMGPLKSHWEDRFVSESEMRERLSTLISDYIPLPNSNSAARCYQVNLPEGQHAEIGFITAMSCNFCSTCDRIRIGSSGEVYPCLMDQQAGNILPAIRPHFDAEKLDNMLNLCLKKKTIEHGLCGPEIMTHIGG